MGKALAALSWGLRGGKCSSGRLWGLFPVESKAKQAHGCCLCCPRHRLAPPARRASALRVHPRCVGPDTSHFPQLPVPSCWLFLPGQPPALPPGSLQALGCSGTFVSPPSEPSFLSFYGSDLTGLIPLEGLVSENLLFSGKGLGGNDTSE